MTRHTARRRDPLLTLAASATIAVGALSFWLSFTALADLARMSGFHGAQSYAWPVIVDGMVVIATIGARRLHGQLLPWVVLAAMALISVAGNGWHAWRLTGSAVAVAVALVPPLVLLVATVLCDRLFRAAADTPQIPDQRKHPDSVDVPVAVAIAEPAVVAVTPVVDAVRPAADTMAPEHVPTVSSVQVESGHEDVDDELADLDEDKALALKLASQGESNYEIGRRVGKSEATIRRWRTAAEG